MKYTLTCNCGFTAEFPVQRGNVDGFRHAEALAERATKKHVEPGHAVTCTRPAHWHEASVPVIVWIATPNNDWRKLRHDAA